METLDCIKTRRSVRNFSEKPIPAQDLDGILEAAIQAPSAGNVQDWRFVVVKSPEAKKALVKASMGQAFISKAPIIIVVCSDLDAISDAYGQRGETLYSIQDTAAAIQNLLLAAWDKGLGTCWLGAFNEAAVRQLLYLPEGVRPVALIPVGYPAENPRGRGRRGLKEAVHWERW